MKLLLFLPIAFLAGADGFAIFAPYLALLLLVAYCVRRSQRHHAALVAIRADGTVRAIDAEAIMQSA